MDMKGCLRAARVALAEWIAFSHPVYLFEQWLMKHRRKKLDKIFGINDAEAK